jgi:carbonic anhydrase/acetyltransferase-like protein (isoleucine patch superfamily)
MAIYELAGKRPVIADDAFVHPDAVLIGDVKIGSRCFIAPGVVIRADMGPVSIGDNTNIQDNAVIHVSPGDGVIIEENVLIAHSVVLHDVHIHPYCMIGMGAILMQNVVCEEKVLVAAGAVVSSSMHIPAHKLVAGNPAKIIKDVPVAFDQMIQGGIAEYQRMVTLYHGNMVKIS